MATGTIGEKQHWVRIEHPMFVSDGHGGKKPAVPPFVLVALVAAHERQLSGAEALRAAQVTAVLSSVWEIWWRDDISVKDRLVEGPRTMQIESFIDPTDTRAELYLFTSEIQG